MRDGRSLLLVEDDETTRDLLSLLLTGAGWTVASAESGDEALRMLEAVDTLPDVILSDLQMPGLSGSPMAIAMRSGIAERSQPPLLIAMTATERGTTPGGFDDLLVKPFGPSDLLQCCEALWRGEASAATKTLRVATAEPSIASAIFDRMKLSLPVAQLRALYDFALTDAESRIVRMSAAMESSDDVAYRREAHALKGSCGMVGVLHLRTLAAEAEDEGLPSEAGTELNPLPQFHAEIVRIRHILESLLPNASRPPGAA